MALNQGTSYIELRAKMDQLERDLKSAETKAGASADRVQGRFSKAASNMGSAFKKAGPIIGSALAAGAAIGVREIIEVEKVMAQTEARLKSTGGQAGVTADDITGLASELQKLSAVDAEEIQSAENLLLTFTSVRNEVGKNNDVFNQATTAALDMSVAMGTDLQGSILQVGKALNDPVRGFTALRRVGVSFTESQQEQIKTLVETGDTMEAQKLILKELQVEFGGSAAAAGKTLGGQLQALKLGLEDAAGGFLRNLRPAIEGSVDALRSYADLANEAASATERQAANVQASKDQLVLFASQVQSGTKTQDDFTKAIVDNVDVLGEISQKQDVVRFAKELQDALDAGTPIAKAFADAEAEVAEQTGKAGKAAEDATPRFSKLFETKDDFAAWREGAVGSLEDISGAFGDLADDANVTAEELIHAFEHQIEATRDFKENLNTLITRGAKPAFIQDLIDMGDQGPVWAKALADSNRETTREFFKMRAESGKQLNSLTGLLNKNAGDHEKWSKRSRDSIGGVTEKLEDLQSLLKGGLAAPGTIRAEFPHGSPTASGIAGSPTAWATAAMSMVGGPQVITSGYRPGDTDSFHSVPPPFNAVDIGGSNLAGVFGALMHITGNKQRELIYGNTIVQRGQVGYYAPNDHWDHVHLADRGAIIKGPAMIAQGNITEAHIPLTGPGAQGMALVGEIQITNWSTGDARFVGHLKQSAHHGARVNRTLRNR